METIKNYLENMFMNLPKTPEINKAKAELYNMMEDKYNELKSEGKSENEAIGIVISEFGNLDELAEELGIKDCINHAQYDTQKKVISMETAKEYITATRKNALKIAIGVFLCICSPIVIVILGGIEETGAISEALAGGAGVTVLLCMIAIAVGIFIFASMNLSRYEYLKKEQFQLDYSTDTYVRQLKDNSAQSFALRITVGVVLCIMAVIPVIITGLVYEDQDIYVCFAVGVLLFIVSIATLFFITAGMERDSYQVLLQEGGYTVNKKEGSLVGRISSIYWPIVVCIYLGYSFFTGDWGRSWIIFPVTGVLFGAISSICNAITDKTK